MSEPMPFGRQVRRARLAAGLTQEALAERAGLSPRAVGDIERGSSRAPQRETVALLAEALGLAGAERVAFEAAARRLAARPPAEPAARLDPEVPSAPPAAPAPNAVPHPAAGVAPLAPRLPVAVTSFVGRDQELADLQRLLPTTRLLTLTGAGGVGKTRLALEVARRVTHDYRDGVWLVELAALAEAGLVADTVAQALGVVEQPGRPPTVALTAWLADRQVLLVLDNCEHLLDACAHLAATLLASCPQVCLLTTSREALGIGGELVWRVPSLALPDPSRAVAAVELAHVAAVRLFAERAAFAQPGFVVTAGNAAVVAEVCVRLDGIPLALELAAARLRVLPVEEVARRLDDRFRLLTGGSRAALPRQQTLRAAIDWSYDLLSEAERVLLWRLAVFAGGCTIAAAEAVCAGEEIEAADVLDLLSHLVDKSLLLAEEGMGGEVRYRLLETVRQYGLERLAEADEVAAIRDRHAVWCLALAEQAEPALHGSEQAVWFDRLASELDNLRAALAWWLERSEPTGPDGDVLTAEAGLRLAGALWRFWWVRLHHGEGRTWLDPQEWAGFCQDDQCTVIDGDCIRRDLVSCAISAPLTALPALPSGYIHDGDSISKGSTATLHTYER